MHKTHKLLTLLVILALTVVVYWPGLNGPFLFDDQVHITQNRWVKIDSLDWQSLTQAWHSSFSRFPSNRPLAQLSFGINHALSGLDPFAFKATNLAIHLLNGVFVFLFCRLALRALGSERRPTQPQREALFAFAVMFVWLIHPLFVSTVLYSVQRMSQLSTLGMLAALTAYFHGRLRIQQDRPGVLWMLATIPFGIVGFLGKENAVLLPLLLLVCELTLLRRVSLGAQVREVRWFWALCIALPLVLGTAYLLTHPGLLSFEGRPFTLEQRALTEPRILFSYLRWLFVPDVSAFGLFHDDIEISSGLVRPPTTLVALLGWAGLIAAALVLRRRQPMFAFAVLFFLAAHALESTVLPLELVFEHRNYLAGLGPLMLLVWVAFVAPANTKYYRLAVSLSILLYVSYALATWVRAGNWSSYTQFLLTSADHHPNSPRANFAAAQLLITTLNRDPEQVEPLAREARALLQRGLAADPNCTNCLFGLLVLDLHLDQTPDAGVLERLRTALRSGYVGPTKVSISQFGYLVKWQQSGNSSLSDQALQSLFDAALANPRWNASGRAGIEASYREFHEFVTLDYAAAIRHARAAIRAWPDQWSYHFQLAQLLRKAGEPGQALQALDHCEVLIDSTKKRDMQQTLRDQLIIETGTTEHGSP